jgi:yecA family protein
MNTPLTPAEIAHLESGLPSTINPSMLDGYLAAVASGPNLAIPDRVLFWVSETAVLDALPGTEIAKREHATDNLIIRHYADVNDALNNKAYVPRFTDLSAWCRGYMAGVRADFAAWEPFVVEHGGLMMQVMFYSFQVKDEELDTATTFLTDVTRQIHAYWLERRQQGKDKDGQLDQLASGTPIAGAGELAPGTQAKRLLH